MLITKGKVAPSEPWKILEVAINQAPDVITLRLSKELRGIHEPGIEALIPFRRDINGNPEWIIEQVYVRGANGSLPKLARVPGIDFIRKEQADEWWVKHLIELEKAAEPKPQTFQLGTFVRVLVGPCARMCGHITAIKGEWLTATIQLRTKKIRVHAQAQCLQIVECAPDLQTFYFSS
jgi:hypothetical protein